MTTSNEAGLPTVTDFESAGPTIPDFQTDAEVVAAYTDARVSYESRAATEAEERTRTTFAKRRVAIRAEIDLVATLLYERKVTAEKALWEYANRYPLRVHDDAPARPSFWETLWSFGTAGYMYNRAVVTAAELAQAQARGRRLERDEDDLEQQLQRALYLLEDARKKNLENPDGLKAFHAKPDIAAMHARVEAIGAERALYAERLAAGDVAPSEQRDREFAQHKILPLEAPIDGITIVRVARFGSLGYFILRDLERKHYALAYDPRLDPLIEHVVDVYWLVDAFKVRPTAGPVGWPMTITEHYAANFADPAEAHAEYRKARVSLSLPRIDIVPMTFTLTLDEPPPEVQLIELLAGYAANIPSATPVTDGEAPE